MKTHQPILGKTGTLIFLASLSAFTSLTTNIFLPALPAIAEAHNTTQPIVNLTLSIYFAVYASGLLFWGPLSEKFGRKPIMLTGIMIYVFAGFCCGLSQNIECLIFARILQAIGGSAVSVLVISIIKDLYDGKDRERIIATIVSLVILTAMVGPILGAFLLKISSWHTIFFALAVFGSVCGLIALCYRETREFQYTGSIVHTWGRLAVVLKNPNFIVLLSIFSLPPMALMAFLAAGAYIYIDEFGLTAQEFSYAFAFNALCSSFGPTIYMKLSKRVPVQKIISICFFIITICGMLIYMAGEFSSWLFAFVIASATLAAIAMRVPGINLMLNQQDKDTGSATAIIKFFAMMSGSLGMMLVVLWPETMIQNIGVIQFSIGLIGSFLWFFVKNRSYVSHY